MLVLKTTSPPVSPGAPAASPSYQMPFSSASVAFMLYSRALSVLERAGDARDSSRGDDLLQHPRPLSRHFDSDDMRADRYFREIERRLADVAPVEYHRRTL